MSGIDAVLKRLSSEGIRRIKLAVTDIDGVLRGKYVSLEKFGASYSSLGICDVIFGWDIGDVLYDNSKYTGWHTGYPDTAGAGRLQHSPYNSLGTGNCSVSDGSVYQKWPAFALSPRQLLQRTLEQAAARGFLASLQPNTNSSFFAKLRNLCATNIFVSSRRSVRACLAIVSCVRLKTRQWCWI